MPEKDDKTEKQTRTTVGIGNTELDRETRTKSDSSSSREGAAYRDDRYADSGYEDEDDYQERARRGARDLGESVRDAGRTVRRESTDLLTAGCDLIGGIFRGIADAISPQGRRGGSSPCGEVNVCGGGSYGASSDDAETTYRGRYRGARDSGARVSTSRTEVRRTSTR